MNHQTILSARQLDAFCGQLAGVRRLALDTEFISEDTYQPQLCLVQVATDDVLAVIDTLALRDLTPFWKLLADGSRETVVHAGREEIGFCLTALDRPLHVAFDTQIAAGLVGMEYPTSYASLVWALLGKKADKGETRTDWRRRPLSDGQIRYALEDVRHLLPLREKLGGMLHEMGRVDWLAAEMAACQDAVQAAKSRLRWRNVSGISGLSSRGLAIVRELWLWRDQQARGRDVPPRRLLRDDLIVEIARRKSAEPNRIRAIRGLNRRALDRAVPALAECVRRGLELPADQLPRKPHRQVPPQLGLLGQFLAAALNSVCKEARIATSIVGTASDVRALVAYRLGLTSADGQGVPGLAKGWRTEVVGTMLDDLLAGRIGVRIQDPTSTQPLVFESMPGPETQCDDRPEPG